MMHSKLVIASALQPMKQRSCWPVACNYTKKESALYLPFLSASPFTAEMADQKCRCLTHLVAKQEPKADSFLFMFGTRSLVTVLSSRLAHAA